MWRKTAICSRDELQESEDLCLTDGNAQKTIRAKHLTRSRKIIIWLSMTTHFRKCQVSSIWRDLPPRKPPQATEDILRCQVFCAKTIVIVKDCCLVAGGLCRSSASLHPPFGTAFLSGAAHKAAAGHAPAEPSDHQIAIFRQKSYSRFNYNFVSC